MRALPGLLLAAAAATTAPWAEAAPTSFHLTPGVATLHVSGARDAVRSLQVNFQVSALPRPVGQTVFRFANYYIAAAYPDGRLLSYTRSGWVPATLETLIPFDGTHSAQNNPPTETLVVNADVASFAGAQIYAAIELDDRRGFYAVLGEVPAPRAAAPVTFPHQVNAWRVERGVDASTGHVRCQASAQATTPDGRVLTAAYGKPDRNASFSWTLSLAASTSAPAMAEANADVSAVRVNDQAWLTLRQWAALSATRPAGSSLASTAYGAIEPHTTSAMAGGTLSARFATTAGELYYDQAFALAGFDRVVDALDHCVTTQ